MSTMVKERAAALAIGLAEEGRLPDPLIRAGIRRPLRTKCSVTGRTPIDSKPRGPATGWLGVFLTGGRMPSAITIPDAAASVLETERISAVSGSEYARTADAWLARLDANRAGDQ